MTTSTTEPQTDPGGAAAAIERYRDLAKYVVAIFAAVGAVLVTGTQLSSLGALSWDTAPGRVVAAVLGLAASLAAVSCIVWQALRVLRPIEMSLHQIQGDDKLRQAIDLHPTLLAGAESTAGLQAMLIDPLLSDVERQAWLGVMRDVTDYAAYRRATSIFEGSWRTLLLAAIAGAGGLAAFAWGANPPKHDRRPAIVEPAPTRVLLDLTDDGRSSLDQAVGKTCVEHPIRALAIGGSTRAPRVVTLPSSRCKAAQFVLDPAWGSATSTERAPKLSARPR